METRAEDADDDQAGVTRWPLYVRVLAVCYVLSYALQVVAFVGLTLPSAFLSGFGRPFDPLVIGLRIAGGAVLIFCWAYRFWFVRWGRRNYPTGKPEKE